MNIGFIGLGNMGMPMLKNLLKAHPGILAFDIVPALLDEAGKAGAVPCKSLDDLSGCSVIFSMLPAGQHVESTFTGKGNLFAGMKNNSLAVDCSTIDAGTARKLHAAAKEKGIRFLDAPVSGGIGGAQAGTLSFLVGGNAEDLKECQPYLSLMGSNIFLAGSAGAGQIAKMCNNMLAAVLMTGTSEALSLGIANGLDPAVLSEIMKKSSGGNWSLNVYNPCPGVMPNVPSSNGYKGGFKTSLMIKDLNLAMDNAKDQKSSVPMGALALQLYRMLAKNEAEDLDFAGIFRLFEKD